MRYVLIIAGVSIAAVACAQTILDPVRGLLLGTPDVKGATWALDGLTYRVSYPAKDNYFVVRLPALTSLSGKSHLDLRLKNNLSRPASLEVDVSSSNGAGWLTSAVVLGPKECIDMTMPLSGSNPYGLRVMPTPTDTTAAQTRSLGNYFASDVRGIYFYNKDTQNADVSIQLIGAVSHTVPTTSIVDTFGQQNRIDWAEKISSAADMRGMIAQDPEGVYPYTADQYGGVQGKNYGPSANFRTVKDGTNWYLVDPDGNRFFSVGVNEVGAQAWTPITGRESLFSDLANLQTNFAGQFSSWGGKTYFRPYAVNLERKYGTTWKTDVVPIFMKRMRSWGFNTVGVSSWDSFMRQQEMPSTFGLNITSARPMFNVYNGHAMSDVFDPAFESVATADIQKRLTESKANQPWNIGMFVDNEMPWGKGKSSDVNYRYGISVAALNSPGTAVNAALVNQLKAKYGTIAKLNTAWATNFTGWAQLNNLTGWTFSNNGPAAIETDLKNFTKSFADKYFSTVKSILNSLGYKGLYLGCRFTREDYSPIVLQTAMKYVDVLSFNIYQAQPSKTNPDLKSLAFPILISEFCFGANDQGRVGMPLYPTMTEASRIAAYKQFFDGLKNWTNVVGAHWYRWEDFPVTAKDDTDNMQEGLQTITDRFYTGLVKQTALSSSSTMQWLSNQP